MTTTEYRAAQQREMDMTKGTKVTIKTTNGGELVTRLLENYHRTYDAIIESGNSYAIILAQRIASIEEVA